ncbi:hypothetical protein LTR56_007296 [Elasticomyces elasticus]|nr:hypothetical protein LTR56_007296 [Elasticomyces elasticus]KAK3662971.1 hypothetical protein LTR22_006135 [Elasticomyces elasticus]KAK4918911.1 hypothetical protein LTR49_013383 [Elasticomyces elasticus]KAK5753795.1 hypothetical protein LTS12_016104 [Elasticomyces elasticus]
MSDRCLYFALPIFLGASFFAVRYALTDIIELTELPPKQAAPETKKDKPEDDITVATLLTLSRSPNPNIAKSAIQLVIARFNERPRPFTTFFNDQNSEDETVRRQCNAAIDFLIGFPDTPERLRRCVSTLRRPEQAEDVGWLGRREIPLRTPPQDYLDGIRDDGAGVMLNFGGIGDGSEDEDDMDEDGRRRLRRETFVVGADSGEE